MIILKDGTRVVDIVKTAEVVENGLLVTRWDDKLVVYGMTLTQEVFEGTLDIDFTKISDYDYANGVFTKKRKLSYTKQEFFELLTKAQVVAIWNSTDTEIQYFVAMTTAFSVIDLTNQDTINAITYMQIIGLITLEQKVFFIG